MLNNTGNASSTQRLLEGQTETAAAVKAVAKPDAWVQAGKTLFQRATGNHASPGICSFCAKSAKEVAMLCDGGRPHTCLACVEPI